MLSKIVSYINSQLSGMTYIDKVYGLAHIGHDVADDGKFPVVYEGAEPIGVNFDNYKSCVFILQDGKPDRSGLEEHPHLACTYRISETHHLRLILYKQGLESVNCDSESQNIANSIAKFITGKHSQFSDEMNLELTTMHVRSISTDRYEIWGSLFSENYSLNNADMLVQIDFDVTIEGVESCFVTDPCETNTVDWAVAGPNLKPTYTDSFTTSEGVNSYTRQLIANKYIVSVIFGNMALIPSQWSHSFGSSTIEFTDTAFPIEAGTYVVIIYHE